jgi:hypothetical protein
VTGGAATPDRVTATSTSAKSAPVAKSAPPTESTTPGPHETGAADSTVAETRPGRAGGEDTASTADTAFTEDTASTDKASIADTDSTATFSTAVTADKASADKASADKASADKASIAETDSTAVSSAAFAAKSSTAFTSETAGRGGQASAKERAVRWQAEQDRITDEYAHRLLAEERRGWELRAAKDEASTAVNNGLFTFDEARDRSLSEGEADAVGQAVLGRLDHEFTRVFGDGRDI